MTSTIDRICAARMKILKKIHLCIQQECVKENQCDTKLRMIIREQKRRKEREKT